MNLHLKNMEEYHMIQTETNKAFNYLRKKGFNFYCFDIETGIKQYKILAFRFEYIDEKSLNHIRKVYKNAQIYFEHYSAINAENDLWEKQWIELHNAM